LIVQSLRVFQDVPRMASEYTMHLLRD